MPRVDQFAGAQTRAFAETERHLPELAGEYQRVVAKHGREAARRFGRDVVVAAADPKWVAPNVDDLIDVVSLSAALLAETEATRQAAAVSATRPLLTAMGLSFSLQAPMVERLMSTTGRRAVALSIPGLQDAVRSAITEAFQEGLSVPQTQELIVAKTSDLAGYQSEMLARTDLIGTANGGSLLAAKVAWPEQGTLTKRWTNATNSNTVNDGRIRETHLVANAQVVDIDEPFTIGEDQLLYPGDPNGSDAEVCNCRCTLVYQEAGVTAAVWQESKHPRWEQGRHEGGRFKPVGWVGGDTYIRERTPSEPAAITDREKEAVRRAWGQSGKSLESDTLMRLNRAVGLEDLSPEDLAQIREALLSADDVDMADEISRKFTVRAAAWEEAKHPRNPAGSSSGGRFRSIAEVIEANPDADLWAYQGQAGIVLSNIKVAPENRGKGIASKALNDLTQFADDTGQTIGLTVGHDPEHHGLSKAQKTEWYKRHGFVPNRGRNKDFTFTESMVRRPNEPPTTAAAWDETKHPRDPGGEGGGQFVRSGEGVHDVPPEEDTSDTSYQGDYDTAPGRDSGSPISNLSDAETGVYPADVYGPDAAWLYGHRGSPEQEAMDRDTVAIIKSVEGKPDAPIKVYRAIPATVDDGINPGDWVTVNRDYAVMHGEGNLTNQAKAKIVERTVRAGDLYMNGNSIHEQGWDPGVVRSSALTVAWDWSSLDGERIVASHVWQSNDWGDIVASPDVAGLAMVAVYPTPEQQAKIAVDGGQPAEKLHCTLVFLGEVGTFDEAAVRDALRVVARRHSTMNGKIGGIGYFARGEDGIPIIALPSVKGLAELRDDVVTELAARGIESPSEHGWTPHLTLWYSDDVPSGLVPDDQMLTFGSVDFVVADERESFPLID